MQLSDFESITLYHQLKQWTDSIEFKEFISHFQSYKLNESLSKHTWFNVGGITPLYLNIYTVNELIYFMNHRPKHIPYFIIGRGSNILVRDSFISSIVIELKGDLRSVSHHENHTLLTASSGATTKNVSLYAFQNGLKNLEFLYTIPGSIGGAVMMNAGCFGFEINDVIHSVQMMTPDGQIITHFKTDLQMTYRSSQIDPSSIILNATFNVKKEDQNIINERLNEYQKRRAETQPLSGKTGGSTFKNPKNSTKKAWELIKETNAHLITVNDAKMSDKHCNFMLNTKNATSFDLETLGNTIQKHVYKHTKIALEWEIIRIGSYEKR